MFSHFDAHFPGLVLTESKFWNLLEMSAHIYFMSTRVSPTQGLFSLVFVRRVDLINEESPSEYQGMVCAHSASFMFAAEQHV